MAEGTKHDAGKPELALVPIAFVVAAARALMFGRGKYGMHNFRQGFAVSRLASALLRHIFAWLDGEDNDPESGLSHLDHAAACLAMLITNLQDGRATDDRYQRTP